MRAKSTTMIDTQFYSLRSLLSKGRHRSRITELQHSILSANTEPFGRNIKASLLNQRRLREGTTELSFEE